jgi:hypothetical protein
VGLAAAAGVWIPCFWAVKLILPSEKLAATGWAKDVQRHRST